MSAALTARSVEILRDLIAFPTISTDSNLAMIDYLAERLTALGALVLITRDETGEKANVFATLGPDVKGGVLLSGHSDVVPVTDQDWTTDPFALTEADGLLYGRGTCDMKGFIAAAMALAESIDPAALKRPLHFAFTHDEETGCLGAGHLVKDLEARGIVPDIAIIGCEPFLNGVAQALSHIREGGLHNVRLHMGDALEMLRRVPDKSLSFVYLLHPDPWPKARHVKRRMMNDGPLDLIAAKLKPGGEFRFGTDHPVYVRHALMVMQRHRQQFDWLCNNAADFQNRPGGWPETRYEAKARRLGHEVWYFRFRRR